MRCGLCLVLPPSRSIQPSVSKDQGCPWPCVYGLSASRGVRPSDLGVHILHVLLCCFFSGLLGQSHPSVQPILFPHSDSVLLGHPVWPIYPSGLGPCGLEGEGSTSLTISIEISIYNNPINFNFFLQTFSYQSEKSKWCFSSLSFLFFVFSGNYNLEIIYICMYVCINAHPGL